MINTSWMRLCRWLAACLLAVFTTGSWAGLSVYTDGTSSPPSPAANQRTINFDAVTLASEQSAGRITFASSAGDCDRVYILFVGWVCGLGSSTGSVSYTASSSLTGFSGNVMSLTSGVNANTTSVTVNFTNATPYVGFLWGVEFNSQNSMVVNLTLADNSVVTLKNCSDTSNAACMAKYVSTNWWNGVFNALFGWIFGDVVDYYSVYVQYQPSNGVKIKSIQFVVSQCANCGFLSGNTSQDFKVDKLTYVDGGVAPDHYEVTTTSASVSKGASTTFTVKACGDATCSVPYINGATGSLSLTGTGLTATYPSGASFTIAAGPTNTATVTASLSPSGTATVGLTGYSPTPSNTTKVFCGLGVAATSTGSCSLTVAGLHHLEVTTGNASGIIASPVTYTIKACGDAACATPYTGGVTGTISVSGVSVLLLSSQSFTILAGASSTSALFTPTGTGTMTASVSSVAPAASNSPALFCGIGVAAASGNGCGYTVGQSLHHMELTSSSASGLTCAPITYTIKACADASCSTPYTSGVSGLLVVTGLSVSYPAGQAFTIANGSSSTTMQVQASLLGTATAVLTTVLPVPTVALPYCGMGTAASSLGSCAVNIVNALLSMSVGSANPVAGASQTLNISAIQSSPSNSNLCVPLFANLTKAITLKCSYANPTSGTLPVTVGGVALNAANNGSAACDGSGLPVNLNFDANGAASTTMSYPDVGQVNILGSISGLGSLLNLNMSGLTSFTAVPASLKLSGLPSTLVAGSPFSVTLKALNSAGAVTPNFGKETGAPSDYIRLGWTQTAPVGTGATIGAFSGMGVAGNATTISPSAFSGGVAALSNLMFTEVGTGSLTPSLSTGSYLGVSLPSLGVPLTVGPFVPHHLEEEVSQGCGSSFTYSGQPFGIKLTALNGLGDVTKNYDGVLSFAKNVTLTASGTGASLGKLGGAANAITMAASSFSQGKATIPTSPSSQYAFTYNQKLTAPSVISIAASDTSGVQGLTKSGGTDTTSLTIRSGRLKVSNFFGSEKSVARIPVQAQFWNGKAWVINGADSCTSLPLASVVVINYLDYKGNSTAAWTTTPSAVTMTGGHGELVMSAPTSGGVGSVDFAFNLGTGSADQSCLGLHPSSTGANLPWLRAMNGSANACNGLGTFDRDPSARVTFGVYRPETQKAVFTRDLY